MKSSSFFYSSLKRTLIVILLLYTALCILVFSLQKSLIYHPNEQSREEGLEIAQQFGAREWMDSSREFSGWMIGPESPTKTVVIFHGNADVAVVRRYLARPFLENSLTQSWQVLLFEYPGFGHRPGNSDEKTIVQAALRAIDSIPGPIVVVGESLGTGVAAHVVAERSDRVEGLLLITPFDNMHNAAVVHYPYLPIRFILTQDYPSDSLLKKYRGKIAFIIAEKDRVTPAWMGEKLYDSLPNPKWKWIIPRVDHYEISHDPQTPWWQGAIQFLQ